MLVMPTDGSVSPTVEVVQHSSSRQGVSVTVLSIIHLTASVGTLLLLQVKLVKIGSVAS